ncbi:MAG TPA: 3-oxoacyl-[acyl-carrier-protein] synthase III C-terminal domain-containing protein [Candidatus Thermoplasmatota archaeon]|nr:3-oxoacyl-[acyl-carrier-protein] synthase III C-terminal domain-containing protein [Candidatus Thermoplasmatota archaeon]
MPIVHGLATSLPGHRLPQEELRKVAASILPDSSGKAGILDVFRNARIDGRNLAMPVEWYLQPHGFAERNEAYIRVGLDLIERASRDALHEAGLGEQDIGAVVLVSTTGIATPSLEARLSNRIGLRPDIARVPIFGLGCAGGVAGLARAADLATADPRSHVLLVAMELCSLSFDVTTALGVGGTAIDKKSLVAASLFADGCAAAVVSGDSTPADGARWVAGASHLFPRTERVMGWDVADDHLEVVLSPGIPDLVRSEMAGILDPFLARHNRGRRPDHWALHPGGARVVDAFREALGLDGDELRFTEKVLREQGNMSSPTALFVLREALREAQRGDRVLASALGPGFSGEFALLEA